MKRLWVLALVAVLGLAGCGGSDDEAAPTSTGPNGSAAAASEPADSSSSSSSAPAITVPSLEDTVRAYTDAFLGGDADGSYALLSERCHGEVAAAQFKDVVDQAHDIYGGVTITSYADEIDGNIATATYELTEPALNQTNERWIIEGGAWRNDDC